MLYISTISVSEKNKIKIFNYIKCRQTPREPMILLCLFVSFFVLGKEYKKNLNFGVLKHCWGFTDLDNFFLLFSSIEIRAKWIRLAKMWNGK